MSMLLDLPEDMSAEALHFNIQQLLSNFSVITHPADLEIEPNVFDAHFVVKMADHMGLVHDVTKFFASRNLNISKLDTREELAPFTSTPLFSLTSCLSSKLPVDVSELRSELNCLGDSKALEIEVLEKKH